MKRAALIAGVKQQVAERLMMEERLLPDPPPSTQESMTRALRGGAAVLMVAAFEAFLDDMVEEWVAYIAAQNPPIIYDLFPEGMRVHDTFTSLGLALNGPKYGAAGTKAALIPAIRAASAMVIAKTLNPTAFSGTAGNPSKDAVKDLLKRIGMTDAFNQIKPKFESKWRRPVSETFVGDKLEEVVQRRHRVVHRADALSIARSDLKEGERFLRIFAEVLDVSR